MGPVLTPEGRGLAFDANVSLLFTELPYLDRFAAARAAGFAAVESWWPDGEDPDRVAEALWESDLRLVALNFDGGEMAQGDRGILSDPARERRFRDNGPYLLDTTDVVAEFIAGLSAANVRLLFDCFHATRTGEDVAAALTRHFGLIGHVQVADSPGRHEPGTGEIDYPGLFSLLESLGYQGHVGLEYRPRTSTEESLAWLAPNERGRL